MDLSAIQKMHDDFVTERGWDNFPASLLILHLHEELSEIGRHILFEEGYKTHGLGDSERKKELASEFAQVFSLLLQLASHFKIGVEKAFLEELEMNKTRFPREKWKKYMEGQR